MRRVIAAFNAPDNWSVGELADLIEWEVCENANRALDGTEPTTFEAIDPTVWDWRGFWKDVQQGVVTPDVDTTTRGDFKIKEEDD